MRVTLAGHRLIWIARIDNREKDKGVKVTGRWLPWLYGIGNMGMGPGADVRYWPDRGSLRQVDGGSRLASRTHGLWVESDMAVQGQWGARLPLRLPLNMRSFVNRPSGPRGQPGFLIRDAHGSRMGTAIIFFTSASSTIVSFFGSQRALWPTRMQMSQS